MRGLLSKLLGFLIPYACIWGGAWLLGVQSPKQVTASSVVAFAAYFLGAYIAGMVAHELGHALAVHLVGERVLGIQLGGKLGRVTIKLGTVPVSLGLGLGGSVSYRGHRLSAARHVVVLAAGPVANVLAAPVCLLLPVPRFEAAMLMLGVLASGLTDLVPGDDDDDGTLSDGSKLWRIRARLRADTDVRGLLADQGWPDRSDAADILINGFRLDVPEAEDCLDGLTKQPDELLRMYRQPWTLPAKPERDVTYIVEVLTWKVLCTSELPGDTVNLAESRAQWVLDHLDKEHPDNRVPLYSGQQTLALARLRQGRAADVRQLCTAALAADLEPEDRASVLALVAMARNALLLSGREQLAEALALDPDADLVREAASVLNGGPDARSVAAAKAS